MTELLKKYPEIINFVHFKSLLQTLSSLQSKCKDQDIRQHILNCLKALVEVEKYFDIEEIEQIQTLWSVIWESTLRSAGLNQNERETHKLLRKLIKEKKTNNFVPLYRIYFSGVITIKSHSLKTLETLFTLSNLPDDGISSRMTLIKWILNVDGKKIADKSYFSEKITADILSYLILKQWPIKIKLASKEESALDFDNFENVYLLNTFEKDLFIKSKENTEKNETSYVIYFDVLNELIHILESQGSTLLNDPKVNYLFLKEVTDTIVLFYNFLSCLSDYYILTKENELMKVLERLLLVYSDSFCTYSNNLKKKYYKNMISIMESLEKLFASELNESISESLRLNFPIDILKVLFGIVKSNKDEDDETNCFSEMQMSCFKVLCLFSCTSNGNIGETQRGALEVLAEPEFNANNDRDYKMVQFTIFISLL